MKKKILITVITLLILLGWIGCYFIFNNTEKQNNEINSEETIEEITTEDESTEDASTENETNINKVKKIINLEDYNNIEKDKKWNRF